MSDLSVQTPIYENALSDAIEAFWVGQPANWPNPGDDEYWGIGAATAWVLLRLPVEDIALIVAERLDDISDDLVKSIPTVLAEQAMRRGMTLLLGAQLQPPSPGEQRAFQEGIMKSSFFYDQLHMLMMNEMSRDRAIVEEDCLRYSR